VISGVHAGHVLAQSQAIAGPGVLQESIDVGQGRVLSYVEQGQGPDVVLLHGTLMTSDDMRLGPMPALSQRFHCVAFDRPGHGRSEAKRFADASLWSQVATIRAAVVSLGLNRPVICGHSSGGAVALAYGLAYPDEIAGVVALAPICFPEPRLETLLFGLRAIPWIGDTLSGMGQRSGDPFLLPILWNAMFLPQLMPDRFAAGFPFGLAGDGRRLITEGENSVAMASDLARSAALYGSCRTPVHILCGDADIVVNSIMHGYQASRLIPGSTFKMLPGIGHMLHHFCTEAVCDAVGALADHAR
jgi:pimeloyl-ACP methyl ester carboxylesterase